MTQEILKTKMYIKGRTSSSAVLNHWYLPVTGVKSTRWHYYAQNMVSQAVTDIVNPLPQPAGRHFVDVDRFAP